jgi:hypothetical protein
MSARDVREIDEFLEVLVHRLDPDAVPAGETTDLWAAFDAVERRAAADRRDKGSFSHNARLSDTLGRPSPLAIRLETPEK